MYTIRTESESAIAGKNREFILFFISNGYSKFFFFDKIAVPAKKATWDLGTYFAQVSNEAVFYFYLFTINSKSIT